MCKSLDCVVRKRSGLQICWHKTVAKLLCTVLGAFPREAQVESGMVSEQTITYLDVLCWVVILVSATLYNAHVVGAFATPKTV